LVAVAVTVDSVGVSTVAGEPDCDTTITDMISPYALTMTVTAALKRQA
jgi:hypothetical protein